MITVVRLIAYRDHDWLVLSKLGAKPKDFLLDAQVYYPKGQVPSRQTPHSTPTNMSIK